MKRQFSLKVFLSSAILISVSAANNVTSSLLSPSSSTAPQVNSIVSSINASGTSVIPSISDSFSVSPHTTNVNLISQSTTLTTVNPSSAWVTSAPGNTVNPGTQSPGGNNNDGTQSPGGNNNPTESPGGNNNNGTQSPGGTTDAGTTPTTGTTTPPPTTIPTTPDPCLQAFRPTDDEIANCNNEECAKSLLGALEFATKCGLSGTNQKEHPTEMATQGENLALRVAEDIKTKKTNGVPVNETVIISTEQLAFGASLISASSFTNTSRGMFYFPNISIEDVTKKLGGRALNSILYPKKYLPLTQGLVKVAWSISETTQSKVPESEIEEYRDIVWRLPLSDIKIEKNEMVIGKPKPKLTINSRIITFTLDPKPKEPFPVPMRLAFYRMKNSGMKNHRCYYWKEPTPARGHWSSEGCDVKNNDTHTICYCTHMSTFVVLSEEFLEEDESARNAFRIVAAVFCILAMAALIGTIHLTRKMDCFENDRVNIHFNLCITLLIGYFLFIVGIIKSDMEVLNHILSFGLYFSQLSPFVWLALEAIYLFDTLHPFMHCDENINVRKLYISFGWAVTAAFAGGTLGYDFCHQGKPLPSEFVWTFIDNICNWYFLGPFVFLFLVNVGVRSASVVKLLKYEKSSDKDKTPFRIILNIMTSAVLFIVVFFAWYFGVKAVNNTVTKGYHYGFIALYCVQAFLVFIIYGWKNEEMNSMYNKKKEEARIVEERKITFTYVP